MMRDVIKMEAFEALNVKFASKIITEKQDERVHVGSAED
jgi:hypothetical protein